MNKSISPGNVKLRRLACHVYLSWVVRIRWAAPSETHIFSLFFSHKLFHSFFSVLRLNINFSAALFACYPFDMVVNCQDRFNKNDECWIQGNGDQDLTTVTVGSLWDDDINVKKDKCQYTIVKQPENKWNNYHDMMNLTLSSKNLAFPPAWASVAPLVPHETSSMLQKPWTTIVCAYAPVNIM